jgi:uncharacterized membrane-anchored protein
MSDTDWSPVWQYFNNWVDQKDNSKRLNNAQVKAEMYRLAFPFDPIHDYCENIRNKI